MRVRQWVSGRRADELGTTAITLAKVRHGVERLPDGRIREADFTDPTAGVRAGLTDVAITRTPFDRTWITTLVLRSDPVGAVLRAGDPLAGRDLLHIRDLADRQWFQLPDGTDPIWRAYWNGTVGVMPMGHVLPEGLTCVRLGGTPASRLVLAWDSASTEPPDPVVHPHRGGELPPGRRRELSLSSAEGLHLRRYPSGIGSAQ